MADESSYKVKANEFEFLFSQAELDSADVIRTGPDRFNVIRNGRSVNVRILQSDNFGKQVKVEVDGEFYTLQIRNGLDQMLDLMGFNNVATRQVREIRAPMPGLVLDVTVQEGQEVLEGDRLLILEAMKMENSITVHASARIKKVLVKKGQPVDKNQILVELE